jgi:4-diphosphocytidyl-2-C-methyl-D-erythritol kinase
MLKMASSKSVMTVDAPAKINLTLRVLGRRADGFHELESVVAAVGLFDRLTLSPAHALGLTCESDDVPAGDDNLVLKAARLLRESRGVEQGAHLRLSKAIPAGRGFGGGSSDAAATLAGLNVLWQLGLSRAELARLGARLGSDVPLFLGTPVSVMRGRGEHLTPVPAQPKWWMALAWPDYGLPTVDVYAAYDRLPADGAGQPAATEILDHLHAPAADVGALLVNDLEAAAQGLRPRGPDVAALLRRAGAKAVGMTGSGSAWFALTDTEAQAELLANAARAGGAVAVVTRMLEVDGNRGGDTP